MLCWIPGEKLSRGVTLKEKQNISSCIALIFFPGPILERMCIRVSHALAFEMEINSMQVEVTNKRDYR